MRREKFESWANPENTWEGPVAKDLEILGVLQYFDLSQGGEMPPSPKEQIMMIVIWKTIVLHNNNHLTLTIYLTSNSHYNMK